MNSILYAIDSGELSVEQKRGIITKLLIQLIGFLLINGTFKLYI